MSCFPSRWRNCRFSRSSRCNFSALSTVSSSFSVEIGFSRKSRAPSRVARTAISICAWPDIMTTGVLNPCCLSSSSKASPSFPGITTSERIKSKFCAFASSSALAALSQTVASCPASRKARESEASVLASSSTISKWAFNGSPPRQFPTGSPACCARLSAISANNSGRSGNSITNAVPFPGWLCTVMVPP